MAVVAHDTLDSPRDRILSSAVRLIHRSGYQATGVQAICQHSGVKKGSFYHFFESKEALGVAVIDQAWEQFERMVLAPAFRATRHPRERVLALFETVQEVQASLQIPTGQVPGCLFANLAAEEATLDEKIRQRLEGVFGDWTRYFVAAVSEARSMGDLPSGLDPHEAGRALLASVIGAMLLAKTANSTGVIRQVGVAAVEAMWGDRKT